MPDKPVDNSNNKCKIGKKERAKRARSKMHPTRIKYSANQVRASDLPGSARVDISSE